MENRGGEGDLEKWETGLAELTQIKHDMCHIGHKGIDTG